MSVAPPSPTSDSSPRGRGSWRILRWVGLGILVLLVALAFGLAWLLASQAGARFALARAAAFTDGKLSVGAVEGRLAGPLTLAQLRWRDPDNGVDARVARVHMDLALLDLLAWRVHFTTLEVADVDVALATLPPRPEQPAGSISLAAPIDIVLDRLALDAARISRDGEPLFALDRLDLAGAWTRLGISIQSLALRAPDGQVDLAGTLTARAGLPGKGKVDFHWQAGTTRLAGTLAAQGDGKRTTVDLTLTEPTPARIEASVQQTPTWPWSVQAQVPRFDPRSLIGEGRITALALDLAGSGDKSQGNFSGEITLNDHPLLLDPLRFTLVEQTLDIQTLTLKAPGAQGSFRASGTIALAATPVSASASLEWDDVTLPAELVGQTLATHGNLKVDASSAAYHAEGRLAVGPPGQLADLELLLDGTPDAIDLQRLALRQPNGGLDAQGTITLRPRLGWQVTANAQRLDPGAFLAEWPGALDFALTSHGTFADAGPEATIKLEGLGGTLRQRPVSGHADLTLQPGYVVDGSLVLAAGASRIQASGRGGGATDADIKLVVGTLGDWLPDAQGRFDAHFHVGGKWPQLAVRGNAHGAGIELGATRVGNLDLRADISDLAVTRGTLEVRASQVAAGTLEFTTLVLDASGEGHQHALSLHAEGVPLDISMALNGTLGKDGRWVGNLSALDLEVKEAPPLALEHPATLAWTGKALDVGELCLAGASARLCIGGNAGSDGALAAHYRITDLPLALLAQLAARGEAPIGIDGMLAGTGDLRRSAAGALDGTATLQLPEGRLFLPEQPGQALLSWHDAGITATLSPQAIQARIAAALDHGGGLDGEVTLGDVSGGAPTLAGQLHLKLNSLAFIELLSTDVANTQGSLEANYRIAGTLAEPQLTGALELAGFAVEVPDAGLKLHDGQLVLRASDAQHFVLEGSLASGQGKLQVDGTGGLAADAPFAIRISGQDFLAADIPAAHVLVSPDLTIERSDERLEVGGGVTIPAARIDLSRLPGGGAAGVSRDVVVTDAEQEPRGKSLPVVVSVELRLGDDVKLAGMGLDGKVSGQLHIDQRPGREATGTGTLNASGTYKAYGQNLSIETGHVMFAGTALDNPGLDIRAVRKIRGASGSPGNDTITVGLQVRGTAQIPVLTVFSRPSMAQSEALSYLITGKPLSGLKSGEGDMLGSAARALGSAGGDLLASKIGARMGLDAGVSDSAALGGAAFTVGKYLSPKLYLSYGVGLFSPGEVVTLKYLFNRRWNFEAENATTGSRAGINYRYER